MENEAGGESVYYEKGLAVDRMDRFDTKSVFSFHTPARKGFTENASNLSNLSKTAKRSD